MLFGLDAMRLPAVEDSLISASNGGWLSQLTEIG